MRRYRRFFSLHQLVISRSLALVSLPLPSP